MLPSSPLRPGPGAIFFCVVVYPDGSYKEDEEIFSNCDNCDHEENGDCQDVREVTMRRAFSTDPEAKELDTANWCEACRMRDGDMILTDEDDDQSEDEEDGASEGGVR